MARKKNDPIETTDIQHPRTKVLKNGAVYDMETKRIVKAPTVPLFNSQNGAEMQKLAIAKKRQVIAAAANLEVQDARLVELFGDYAYIAEGAVNMQRLATSPEAGKAAVMAYESLIRNTGHDEKSAKDNAQPVTAGGVADLVGALASFVAAATGGNRDVIDVTPMRQENEDDES